ncbi:polyribonucleotide nucleotidyltransferase [Cerasicoccus frondis]|uniref:polyribonucleotide nucleotidyltransferase n=1 Tax=Cerasicoccus frondis TaxID=490090 RepID=UPI002852BFDF|nr:polyribonucleotide nucleotidyltransferase [Cerasicoccus frondis]
MKQEHSVYIESLDITIASGTIAKQANGAVTITKGETTLFVSATAAHSLRSPDQDFFPLTVDYRERFAAAGRFPGGYFKREGRPSEKEILTSRLCDRPLRPLFPKGFLFEVQVIGILMSTDLVNDPDVLMVNAASAACLCSDIPWHGPIGCIRLGEIDGEFVVNPTHEEMFESTLDLIYVGNEKEMMMIEGSADQLPESRFIEALEFAQNAIQPLIAAQKELAAKVGKTKKDFDLIKVQDDVLALCRETVGEKMQAAVFQDSKVERGNAVSALKDEAVAAVKAAGLVEEDMVGPQINMAFEVLQEELYRENILVNKKRVDGRGPDDLRNIHCETDVLPRVHGSSLFQRGETQGIVSLTLGTSKDSQDLDALTGGVKSKSFILHYNFPPFSVGECGRFTGPGRREIGHGALAERSLLAVLPGEDEFPYSIRLVSDIFESNGSTSMASVCGGTLSLMDAGVPISAPVAGISVGLVTRGAEEGNITESVILTDIIGAEDHFGDMDFKICGTKEGITGFQLDLKIKGIPMELAKQAIYQNKIARDKILDIMTASIEAPSTELKPCAPRIEQVQIDPEKIGALIGPGGKNIKRIVEITGAQIDINEDNSGRVLIFATDGDSMQRAINEIELVTAEIEPGKTYKGIVRAIKEFGCFVECLPGKEGLVHVSELAEFRVEKVEDVCKLGDEILVKCVGIDDKGRVRLSRLAALCEAQGKPYEPKNQGGGDRGGRGDRKGGRGDRGGRGGDRGGRGRDGGRDGGRRRRDDDEGGSEKREEASTEA